MAIRPTGTHYKGPILLSNDAANRTSLLSEVPIEVANRLSYNYVFDDFMGDAFGEGDFTDQATAVMGTDPIGGTWSRAQDAVQTSATVEYKGGSTGAGGIVRFTTGTNTAAGYAIARQTGIGGIGVASRNFRSNAGFPIANLWGVSAANWATQHLFVGISNITQRVTTINVMSSLGDVSSSVWSVGFVQKVGVDSGPQPFFMGNNGVFVTLTVDKTLTIADYVAGTKYVFGIVINGNSVEYYRGAASVDNRGDTVQAINNMQLLAHGTASDADAIASSGAVPAMAVFHDGVNNSQTVDLDYVFCGQPRTY